MSKIAVAEVLEFAESTFPQAPEKLVENLKVEVRYSPLNCDGWCLESRGRSIIRINSSTPATRQRFTLAHELGHLILGIPSIVGESIFEVPRGASREEKQVNELASQMLLPTAKVKEIIREIPVTAAVIRKMAKTAGVSELAVACRLASLVKDIGLKDALVVFYKDDIYKWQYSETVGVRPTDTAELLSICSESHPSLARTARTETRDVLVGCFLENPAFGMKTVFAQVVDEEDGLKTLDEERVRQLEKYIFSDFPAFQRSLQGSFGWMRSSVKGLSLDQAVALFNGRYLRGEKRERWDTESLKRLESPSGQEYIALRLKVWL